MNIRTVAGLFSLVWAGAAMSLALAMPREEFGFHKGLGGISIGTDRDVDWIVGFVRDCGFNSIQCPIPTKNPAVAKRIERLHRAGFWVFGYATAFIYQREPEEDFQIRADGTVKKGWVCPRSMKRLRAMAARMEAVARTGADGMFWDFITVESREREACFCPKCVAAFNKAAGLSLTREQLVKALDDPKMLAIWRKVREESTTAAIRYLSQAAARISARRGRPFLLGGYVIGSHSDLGMDTAAMYRYLDVGAPMIYQGPGRIGLGWMKRRARTFVGYGGKARNIVCVDTGFWVDQPPRELIATCLDCIRAGTDGYALWPYQCVSADDLLAVAGVNEAYDRFYARLRRGDARAAAAGLRGLAGQIRSDLKRAGGAGADEGSRAAEALEAEAAAVEQDPARAQTDDFAKALYAALLIWADARIALNHMDDRVISLPPYRVTIAARGGGLTIETSDWTLRQNDVAENIDEVTFADNPQDCATGAHSLGLLRARVIGWFDGWTTRAQIAAKKRDRDTVVLTTTVESPTCRLERDLVLRRGNWWIEVVLRVTNICGEPKSGRVWLWNGWGYPGFMEAGPQPWSDDQRELTKNNVLIAMDEDHYVALAGHPNWPLGKWGSNGVSHAYRSISLKPGETFSARLKLTFGRGGRSELADRLKDLSW